MVFYAENIDISNMISLYGDIDLSEMEFADNKSKIFYIKVKANQEGINVYSPTNTWEYTLNAE